MHNLKDVVQSNNYKEINQFLKNHMIEFFSSSTMPNFYKIIKPLNFYSLEILPKLIYSWLAFLSGDHASMMNVMETISEDDLETSSESSFYYGLKAFISSMLKNKEEGFRYAKLSIDILPTDEISLYKANGHLTYGQLLSSDDKYRKAAEAFKNSAKIFKSLKTPFLFVVAKVNELLNLYKLGEYNEIFSNTNELFLKSESYTDEIDSYWNLLHLPLGLCYFELNKPSLAVKHLLLSKKYIDQSHLFHMHGMIELYLFKAYTILNDQENINNLIHQLSIVIKNMNYPQLKLLLTYFKIANNKDTSDINADIELLEIEYLKGNLGSYSVVVETLVYLKLIGLSNTLQLNDLIKALERYKYIGNISYVQLTLIQLSELCLLEEKTNEANEYIKEAISIYKEYGISANFYLLPLKSINLIRKLDKTLYLAIEKNRKHQKEEAETNLLTGREKEILDLIALGKTNKEISEELYISIGTIKWHINHIFSKLQVKNRIKAVEKAKKLNIL